MPFLLRILMAAWPLVSLAAEASVNVQVDLRASSDPATAGLLLTYTTLIRNVGTSTATQITVTNNLPPGLAIKSATSTAGSATIKGSEIVASIGNLAAGASAQLQVIVLPSQPGVIVISASAFAAEHEDMLFDNAITIQTEVQAGNNIEWKVTSPRISPDRHFECEVETDSGKTYILQASTDMAVWADVSTASGTGGLLRLRDPAVANANCRFYRVFRP
jgi:uncharacterized repeat protein (TIGR01451 family)